MPGRSFILHEATYRQLLDHRPNVAILPWGATEAHNYHLPHGTDVIEATSLAEASATMAHYLGARTVVLPTIPFGNNAQQLDQVATISISTTTAAAMLADVAASLVSQKIDRLVILNAHGGNEFKPLVRDVQARFNLLVVVINFFQMLPDMRRSAFEIAGDHADEMETSLLLHLKPDWVAMEHAGGGATVPFKIGSLKGPGVWTPRPWSASHPDTGAGDPSHATAEKGKTFHEALCREIATILVDLSKASKGELPYL